jgi:hypothetical protein
VSPGVPRSGLASSHPTIELTGRGHHNSSNLPLHIIRQIHGTMTVLASRDETSLGLFSVLSNVPIAVLAPRRQVFPLWA